MNLYKAESSPTCSSSNMQDSKTCSVELDMIEPQEQKSYDIGETNNPTTIIKDRQEAEKSKPEIMDNLDIKRNLNIADLGHIDRQSILNYRRSLKSEDTSDLAVVSYLTFIAYFLDEAKLFRIIFTSPFSNEYEIKDENDDLIVDLDSLSEICKKQLVKLELSYEDDYSYTSEEADKQPIFIGIIKFFETFKELNNEYFLYSINILLPEAHFDRDAKAEDVKEIYELVLSSGRSFWGSLGGYFWSKYHAHDLYMSLNNWMMNSQHEPGSIVDIFHHSFSQNALLNSDWADQDIVENVESNFHKTFFCGKPIYQYQLCHDKPLTIYEDYESSDSSEPSADCSSFASSLSSDVFPNFHFCSCRVYKVFVTKINIGVEFLKQAIVVKQGVVQPESNLNISEPFPHIVEKIILDIDTSLLRNAEKKQLLIDFVK